MGAARPACRDAIGRRQRTESGYNPSKTAGCDQALSHSARRVDVAQSPPPQRTKPVAARFKIEDVLSPAERQTFSDFDPWPFRNSAAVRSLVVHSEVAMTTSNIVDCPTRPPCRICGTNMITVDRIVSKGGFEGCVFECLRCGHTEHAQPVAH